MYRQKKETPASIIAGEAAIVTQTDSRLHILNEVGTQIWQICDVKSGISFENIIVRLLEEYDVTEGVAREETEEFLRLAINAGIIEHV